MVSQIFEILDSFSARQESAFVDFREFCDYVKRYAERKVQEFPEFSQYLENPESALTLDLERLAQSDQILLLDSPDENRTICVISFYIQKIAERFKEVLSNPASPFPTESELPKSTPKDILTKNSADDYIFNKMTEFFDSEEILFFSSQVPQKNDLNQKLFSLEFQYEIPALLFPSTIPILNLLNAAFYKLRAMLHREEYHDYFQKKVCISNPGKEMSAKNFFRDFVFSSDDALVILKHSEDNFYFWSQLCFFIRQDYEKVKDKTSEDISILQSIAIVEIAMSFFKDRSQKNKQKSLAFETLTSLLRKPPYYYTFDAVLKFQDVKGVPLTNYYSLEELKEYLHNRATETVKDDLPELLVFKVENGTSYFIAKEKVLPVVARLCSDARIFVRDEIKKSWHNSLLQFETLLEMKDDAAFEKRIERETRISSPVLYALLNTSFLPVLSYESFSDDSDFSNQLTLFSDGKLLKYSEILLMKRGELFSDAKILLPFWYSFPLFVWLAKLLLRKPKKKNQNQKTQAELYREEEEKKRKQEKDLAKKTGNTNLSNKVALHEAAREIETQIVPQDSTLERELESYKNQWNFLINKTARENLTTDVNSLIRDYMRRILRTLGAKRFTLDRVRSLADSLTTTPALQKIQDHNSLNMYIQLYIVKLVKNLPT